MHPTIPKRARVVALCFGVLALLFGMGILMWPGGRRGGGDDGGPAPPGGATGGGSAATKDAHHGSLGAKRDPDGVIPISSLRDTKGLAALIKRKITPSQAAQVLSSLEGEVANIDERALIAASVIAGLCSGGHAGEAWDLISEAPGLVRESQLASWFINNQLPIGEAVERFNLLTDGKDREKALQHMFVNRANDLPGFDPDVLKLRSDTEKRLFGDSIVTMIGEQRLASDLEPTKALLDKSVSLASSGAIPIASSVRALAAAGSGTGFDQWRIIQNAKESLLTRDLEELMKPVAANIVAEDAAKALGMLTSDPSTRYSYAVLNAGMKKYYSIAPDAANKWVTDNIDRIDAATAQRMMVIVAQEATRNNEYDTAQQWAARILNEDVRHELEEQIRQHEAGNRGESR